MYKNKIEKGEYGIFKSLNMPYKRKMQEKFKEKLKNKIKSLEIELNNLQLEQFYNYMNQLLEWNEKLNLTAITNEDDIILKHFIDSLTITKYLKASQKIVDLGTGAGFPGIPIAIYDNSLNVTLVDSLNKRINFLKEVIKEQNLKNIVTIHSRAEDFGQNKNYRESFDVATSRAVANLSVLVEYMLPTLKVGGIAICMKGSEIDDEVNKSKNAIKELGGKIVLKEEFFLPDTNMKRNIIIIEKLINTPKKYPRKAGIPTKQPL